MKTAVNLVIGKGMRGWIIAPSGLIEPTPAPEILVDGIGAIEAIGGGDFRYHLVQEQMSIDCPAAVPQKVVVLKVVAASSIVPMTIGQLAQCMIRESLGMPPTSGKPRLVT